MPATVMQTSKTPPPESKSSLKAPITSSGLAAVSALVDCKTIPHISWSTEDLLCDSLASYIDIKIAYSEHMAFRLPRRTNPSTIRPLEIGRRLLRAIDDNVDIDIKGRRVSPDNFTIALSEPDRASLANEESALLEELTAAAIWYIRDEGLNVLTAVKVAFTTDESLDTGRLSITTVISGQQIDEEPIPPEPAVEPPAEPEVTDDLATPKPPVEPVEVPDTETPPAPPVDLPPPVVTTAPEPLFIKDPPEPTPARAAIGAIVQRDGTRHPAGNLTLKMGRSTDNDIRISDEQASRHHAEIRYDHQRHRIVDLNSTNGTLVNDNRITSAHALSHGDIITIGTTEFRYESS